MGDAKRNSKIVLYLRLYGAFFFVFFFVVVYVYSLFLKFSSMWPSKKRKTLSYESCGPFVWM